MPMENSVVKLKATRTAPRWLSVSTQAASAAGPAHSASRTARSARGAWRAKPRKLRANTSPMQQKPTIATRIT